ncbi:MAG: ATP synthase F1 subunit delta, partial [Candidatus Doudnabacteria bacterium]|nr:ATP synthase F1 subunit delta [Candidatus Doudnabacteria bacterium]
EYARALLLAVQESRPEDYELIIENLVALLSKNGDLEKLSEITAEFEHLLKNEQMPTQVQSTFAREVTRNKVILDELNALAGARLEVRSQVDDELVGGMVLRVDDTLVDASVKSQLERMKNELSS